ncbi:MAG TPA: SDR family oxidoreductase [Mycobacteriales bacterium]|jgi:NAD(P)-dependent dehydrogenase (short-subunit alcohol dehydrogenase family)|nr:SDR family oxidoreductase [Mycobacteriales bacterium]
MSDELAGKVAIITGAGNGIGQATAEVFVAEGAKVVIADIDAEAGGKVAADLGDAAHFVPTDVSDVDSVNALVNAAVEHFGKLDCIVNNAGISGSFRRLMMDDLRDFQKVIQVDLLGVILGTQAAARVMQPGGSIVNTTSIAGIQPGVGFTSYRAAKAGVIHFSRCAAIELAELGLRVNVIAPGNIQTKINAIFDTESVVAQIQPLQRLGSPTDLANAAVYLASDRAAQVTGVVLPVDGGTTAGHPPLKTETVFKDKAPRG